MVRSDLFKIPPLICPGHDGFSGSFGNVTRCLTAHQWWRERELGSQRAVEGQPNVSCWAWLVNIPRERCKRPLTQTRPAAHRSLQMRLGVQSEQAKFPTNLLTPTKKSFLFVIHMPLRAQCLPINIHASLCLCNTYLTVELVGGWAWVNASLLGTLLHLWS